MMTTEEAVITEAPPTTEEPLSCMDQIGHTAGLVWHALDRQGPQTVSKLVKSIDASRDVVMQAIGWLAREDKVWIEDTKRGRMISLK
jgi:hypothetical protein